MANVLIEEETMKAIGKSIRGKNGESDLYLPKDMPAKIDAIEGGTNLGHNVTFKVDGKPYQITSVLEGGKVTAPIPPTSTQGVFEAWQKDEKIIGFPFTPNLKDTIIDAKFSDDLVFYAPLNNKQTIANTGQALTFSGNETYITESNVECCSLSKASLTFDIGKDFFTSGKPFTITCWIKADSVVSGSSGYILFGNKNIPFYFWARQRGTGHNSLNFQYKGKNYYTQDMGHEITTKWSFVTLEYDGINLKWYYNTSEKEPIQAGLISSSSTMYFNESQNNYSTLLLASVRAYSKALSIEELTQLYNEFQPTDREV